MKEQRACRVPKKAFWYRRRRRRRRPLRRATLRREHQQSPRNPFSRDDDYSAVVVVLVWIGFGWSETKVSREQCACSTSYSFFCREFVFLLSEENCTTKIINTVRVVVDECDYIRTKRLGRVEVYSGTRVRASTRETSPRTFSSLFLCPIPRILVWSPKTYRYLS